MVAAARAAGLLCGVFERCEPRGSEPSLSLAETLDEHLVPAGAHRLFIQVADDRGRFTEREVRFRVGN